MSAPKFSRRNLIAAFGLAAAAALLPVAAVAAPQPGEWVLLGTERVGHRPDKDVIVVGRDEGRFERIMLKVRGNDVHFGDVNVVYANGQSDHLNIGSLVRAGESSGAFHVSGRHRVIDRIELLYRAESGYRRPATVEVYGQLASFGSRPEQPVGGWQVLGTQTVDFGVDRDTIVVGADKGRFRSIKLDVHDRDVHFYSARVIFGSGETQDLPVSGLIRRGSSTGSLDLGGYRGRRIERIEFAYRSRFSFHGRANVTVLGQH